MTVTNADIDRTVAGQTLASRFVQTVAAHGARTALRWKQPDDSWAEWTFDDYADKVARAASFMQAAGVKRGDRIVLMMRNIPEFHAIDLAALYLGATPISIYNSSSPEQIAYLAGHCDASWGVVEDRGYYDRFTKVRDQLPDLRGLAVLRSDDAAELEVPSFDDLIAPDPIDLAEAAKEGQPKDLVTVIYTSGTTGPPKGVMLDNHNATWTLESLRLSFDLDEYAGKRLVSYLPMAHIAERNTSHYLHAALGFEVTCCPVPGQIAAYAREVHPNLMFGVPRVWEKIQAGVVGALAADPDNAAKFAEAIEAATPITQRMAWDEATDEDRATYEFLDRVAFKGVRAQLGLDQIEVAISGAAPIRADLLAWFRAVGVPMSEIYGMSESTGPVTWTPYRIKPGTVGPAIPGCEVELAEDGEVIFRGGNVFKGYLGQADKTAEVIDADGWMHTGDIGQFDDDGYLKIVDRKKELIITAGGKNISPANLESALKTVPLVGQACAIGDQRPFVSALVVLDPDTAPAWARQQGLEFESVTDLAANPDVIAEVERGVQEAMMQFNNAEQVKKVKVLGEEWLPDSVEMTPTSKLKRRGIHTKYEAEIEALYA